MINKLENHATNASQKRLLDSSMFIEQSFISEQTDSAIGSTPLKNSMTKIGLTAKELLLHLRLQVKVLMSTAVIM